MLSPDSTVALVDRPDRTVNAATIYDVARRAGVSHQTVTRFLHGYKGIRPETRARVEAALTELDYRPNSAARLLRSRRTNRIGVLADRIDQSGPARILAAASELAREKGYVLDIVVADGTSAESVAASLAMLLEHQVAGIFATAQTEVVLEELRRQAVAQPLVIDAEVGIGVEGVTVNEAAGRCAADHLLALGHRRIGYLSGPEVWLAGRERFAGFTRRLAEAGVEPVWTREGDWSVGSGDAAWRSLSKRDRSVTAVGVANDSMAIGLISGIHASGLSVPQDVSVVGTDDLPEARYIWPAMSTVVMDFEGEGRRVLETLLAKIEDKPEPGPITLAPPHIVERASTRALVSPR
jgi:DNA-binding LacI/PurR family transcriptional regulator